jgi:hypothetical protein
MKDTDPKRSAVQTTAPHDAYRRWYIGERYDFCTGTHRSEAFTATETPRQGDYPYLYVIGPFKTKRAAKWAEKYGHLNPHFQHVNDAERIAAQS